MDESCMYCICCKRKILLEKQMYYLRKEIGIDKNEIVQVCRGCFDAAGKLNALRKSQGQKRYIKRIVQIRSADYENH